MSEPSPKYAFSLIRTEVETSHQNVFFLSAVLKVIHQKISISVHIGAGGCAIGLLGAGSCDN